MANITFPSNPTIGQRYTFGNQTWQWTGTTWDAYNFMAGMTGPTGPTGPTGATGEKGDPLILSTAVWQSGSRHTGSIGPYTQQALALAANTLYLNVADIFSTQTVAGLSAYVTTGASGKKLRCGLYADNGSELPGNLIEDCGELDVTNTGYRDFNFASPRTLTPGRYWLAVITDGTPTLRRSLCYAAMNFSVNMALGSAVSYQLSLSQTYGPLPSSASSATPTSSAGNPFNCLFKAN